MAEQPIVTMRGVTKAFRGVCALNLVDLDVFPGHIIGLLGANGAGKSTLLRHIIGLYLPDPVAQVCNLPLVAQTSGLHPHCGTAAPGCDSAAQVSNRPPVAQVSRPAHSQSQATNLRYSPQPPNLPHGRCYTFDCDAARLGPRELARIGYVHQEGELLDWMTVRQIIRYVAAYYPNWNRALEERLVAQFELSLGARVGTLSPGQRQRLAILLAVGHEPELLILDEPAAALDPIARAQFLHPPRGREIAVKLRVESGKTKGSVVLPEGLAGALSVNGETIPLKAGRNQV